MFKLSLLLVTAVSFGAAPAVGVAAHADTVVNYSSGTGFVPGYDNPAPALGEPSRVTPGAFGGPVNPFSPAYLPEQVVSIGAGGSLTLSFNAPIPDAPANPYGLDFILFGNNGFMIVNGDFGGGGITDGSTFTFDPPGSSSVFVSEDNVNYFELVPPPGMSAIVDGLFPTDGMGDFQTPVDPALSGGDFDGAGLSGIAALYAGSGGGTGFDLAWAQTAGGLPAGLSSARYVRVDVFTGKIEIDAVTVVPEPGTGVLAGLGALVWCGVWWRRRARRSAGNPVHA